MKNNPRIQNNQEIRKNKQNRNLWHQFPEYTKYLNNTSMHRR